MSMMRWQLAYPGHGRSRSSANCSINAGRGHGEQGPAGNVDLMPDFYNSFGAMHGTIMVFLAIVPLAFGAFGNFVTPLQIGAPDMTFPRVNMVSYQFYFMGGVLMLASFFIPGGAAKSGWTSYSPLATVTTWCIIPTGRRFGSSAWSA
jgi:cytochrome c oxidase subunit 1